MEHLLPASVHGLYFVCAPGSEGFPGGSDSKASACNAGNLGSIPGSSLNRPMKTDEDRQSPW